MLYALRSRFTLVLSLVAVACSSVDPPSSTGGPEPEPKFDYPLDDVLRLHHLQAKATHNSYHVEPPGNTLPPWAYTHAPLDEQLEHQGVRSFELDLRLDDDRGELVVFHIEVLDQETTCLRFVDCLSAIRRWSDAHRAHHPLLIQIEPKDAYNLVDPDAWFARLETEIKSVWPAERILTPDLVQGDAATLGAAVAEHGWPTLGRGRGRVVFALDESGKFRDHYSSGGTSLEGRLLFVDSRPGDALGAFAVMNDPIGGQEQILSALQANFLVRTRSDADGVEPLAGDTARRDAALAGGAQLISTDYPTPLAGIDYSLEIPNGAPTRCNPVTAPAECTSEAIEDPAFIAGGGP